MSPQIQNAPAKRPDAIIWTEGKTDWKHLKKAAQKLRLNLNIAFHEYEDKDMGDQMLLSKCKTFAESLQSTPMIFVFDRDNEAIIKEIGDTGYKAWGNRVYSLAIPIPSHREDYDHVCIELYYSDQELTTTNSSGRRLFLTTEFNESSGTHNNDPLIHLGNKGKLGRTANEKGARIIDADVYRGVDSIALSKAQFADGIYNQVEPFNMFSFAHFNAILDIIEVIIRNAKPSLNLYIADQSALMESIKQARSLSDHCSCVLHTMFSILQMVLELFIVSTVRCYEDVITSEPDEYKKKVGQIKEDISEGFTEPSMSTLYKLAKHCFYLVDEKAAAELQDMKACLDRVTILGPLGLFLDEMERVFPLDNSKARVINRVQMRRSLLGYLLPELLKYDGKFPDLEEAVSMSGDTAKLDYNVCEQAFDALLDLVTPILSPTHTFVLRTLERADSVTGTYVMSVITYNNFSKETEHRTISFDEYQTYQDISSELIVTGQNRQESISLFPFLIIKDDRLYFYKRTRASGYEYHSAMGNRIAITPTKRKFNHALFGVTALSDSQALFWTEVVPNANPVNGIKANIPVEVGVEFVGRKKQIRKIIQEVVEIPNQNGIIYGPGGVGKTALMLQVSKVLFDESDLASVAFENIIWVSAKSDYYNPILNIVEKRKRRFQSLDNVLSTILRFFGHDDIEEYDTQDKKQLVLDLLEDNRVLLILDNFETVPEYEARNIISYFGIDVKQRLKKKPDYFKVIVTSRKQIPSGFHQIQLAGLDLRESKLLMTRLCEHYRDSKPELTDQQKEAIHLSASGIPIIIKHCIGQVYEYNEPLDGVLRKLCEASTEVVKYSFAEVFRLLKEDATALRILILMELVRGPLLIRQISEILEINESDVERKIPLLLSFQCLERASQGRDEKYSANDEIRIFTRSLAQENAEIAQAIRKQLTRNFSVDKQMDYTSEEFGILIMFNNYLSEKQYLEAEDFIKDQLERMPESVLLNFYYAKYLKEQKRDFDTAIKILDEIRPRSRNHPSILRLLVSCFTSLDVPNYTAAKPYVNELENSSLDNEVKLEVAEFYVQASTAIKTRAPSLDPIQEMLRQQEYKELAEKALKTLTQLPEKTSRVYHLLAQSYYNKWDYFIALKMIDQAIELADPRSSHLANFRYLRGIIIEKAAMHGHRLAT